MWAATGTQWRKRVQKGEVGSLVIMLNAAQRSRRIRKNDSLAEVVA